MGTKITKTVAFGLLVASFGFAYAQTEAPSQYPSRRITLIVTGPGGGIDFIARVLAQAMPAELHQPVVVENRPSGLVPGQTVAKAPPDGYTLIYGGGALWITPLLQESPYDPIRDFAPVSMVHDIPQVLVAHPSLPVRSVKDLIALARARPGQIHFAASNVGSSSTLAGELLADMARINMVRVPYKSAGARMTGLLSGEVQIEFSSGATYANQIKTGKVRALGVSTPKRWSAAPDVPPISDTLPGFESRQVGGLLAPAKTPPAIIARLNEEVQKVIRRAEVREKLTGAGVEVVGSTPEQFGAQIKSEIDRTSRLIKSRGLRETQ